MCKLSGSRFLKYALPLASVIVICITLPAQPPAGKEPISFIGHGAMFDQNGKEVAPTIAFIRDAQAWYRNDLLGRLTKSQRAQFDKLEQGLTRGLTLDEQSRLVLNTHLIDWLITTSKAPNGDRIRGKINL